MGRVIAVNVRVGAGAAPSKRRKQQAHVDEREDDPQQIRFRRPSILIVRRSENVADAATNGVVHPGQCCLSSGLQIDIHALLHEVHRRRPEEGNHRAFDGLDGQHHESVLWYNPRVYRQHARSEPLRAHNHAQVPMFFYDGLGVEVGGGRCDQGHCRRQRPLRPFLLGSESRPMHTFPGRRAIYVLRLGRLGPLFKIR
jgi:hypothetical protein